MASKDETAGGETAEDAITASEITGTAPPPSISAPKRNAFTALMSTRKTLTPNPHSTTHNPTLIPPPPPTTFTGRNGLGAFLSSPQSFPPSQVLFHTPTFVAVPDLYPKATVHTLLLPRDLGVCMKHPLLALQDEGFLAELRPAVARLRGLVAAELRRRFGGVSGAERGRRAAMDKWEEGKGEGELGGELPEGRDWESEVVAGVHAGPSMAHLHVHVLSRDMRSGCMRHRKHYNSFKTEFFVGVGEFPLGEGEVERRLEGRAGWLKEGLRCWRCGREFGGRFKELKAHLEGEWEEWVRE